VAVQEHAQVCKLCFPLTASFIRLRRPLSLCLLPASEQPQSRQILRCSFMSSDHQSNLRHYCVLSTTHLPRPSSQMVERGQVNSSLPRSLAAASPSRPGISWHDGAVGILNDLIRRHTMEGSQVIFPISGAVRSANLRALILTVRAGHWSSIRTEEQALIPGIALHWPGVHE